MWKSTTVSVISENLSPIFRIVSEKFSFKNSKFTKNALLINFFVTQLFRSFRWLIFPSILLSKSWKLRKLLKLISSFNFWIILGRIYGHGFYELSRMLRRKNVNDHFSKVIERFHCGMFWLRFLVHCRLISFVRSSRTGTRFFIYQPELLDR